jgi:hypothetical protein
MKADAKTQPLVAVSARPQVQPFRELLQQAVKDAKAPGDARPMPKVRAQGAPPALQPRQSASAAVGGTPIARITLTSATSATAATVAKVARGRVEAEAQRLQDVRQDHHGQAKEVVESRLGELTEVRPSRRERVVELITRELVAAFEDGSTSAANDPPAKGAPLTQAASAPTDSTPVSTLTSSANNDLRKLNHDRAAQAVALIEKIEVFVKQAQRPALELTLNNSLGAKVEIERMGPGEVAVKLVGTRGPPSPDAVSRIRDELLARGLKVSSMSVA